MNGVSFIRRSIDWDNDWLCKNNCHFNLTFSAFFHFFAPRQFSFPSLLALIPSQKLHKIQCVWMCVRVCAHVCVPHAKLGQQSCSTFSLQKVAMRELFPVVSARSTNVSVYCHRSQSWSSIVSASWLFTFRVLFIPLWTGSRERERGRRFRHQIVAGVTSEGRYAGKVNKCSSNYVSVFSVLWKVSASKHWRSHCLCRLPLPGWGVTTQEVGHSYPCPCLHTSKISESVQIVHRSLLFGTAFRNDSHICYTAISS